MVIRRGELRGLEDGAIRLMWACSSRRAAVVVLSLVVRIGINRVFLTLDDWGLGVGSLSADLGKEKEGRGVLCIY